MSDEVVSVRDTMEAIEANQATETTPNQANDSIEQISNENIPNAEESTGLPETSETLQAETPQPEAITPEPVITPPASWGSDEKEMFKSLPLEAQKVIARRESERDKGFYQGRQELAEIKQATAPYEAELKRNGIPVSKAITQMFEWDKYFRESPYEALAEMARKLGVDLRQVGQVVQAAEPQDPYVRQLMESNAEMQARFQQMEMEKEEAFRASLAASVETFASAKDQNGNLLHPHIERLAPDMEALIPFIKKNNPQISDQDLLKEAYQRAERANPDTWSSYQKQLEQKRKMEEQNRLQRAKRASSSLSGSLESGSSTTAPAEMSIRQTIEAIDSGLL